MFPTAQKCEKGNFGEETLKRLKTRKLSPKKKKNSKEGIMRLS